MVEALAAEEEFPGSGGAAGAHCDGSPGRRGACRPHGQARRSSASIKTLAASATRVETALAQADAKIDGMQGRFARVEAAAKSVTELHSLVQALGRRQGGQSAGRLMAPDGDLQKQRQASLQLSTLALQTRATVDGLKADQERLGQLRGDLSQAVEQLQKTRDQAAAATTEVGAVRTALTDLTREQTRIRETSRESRRRRSGGRGKGRRGRFEKLAGFHRLQEVARTLDERVGVLNATVEHVMQRSKVLEQQKHTVERAIIESHRLAGMVTELEAGRPA